MVLIEVIKDGKTGGSKIMPGFLVMASGEYTGDEEGLYGGAYYIYVLYCWRLDPVPALLMT